MNETLVKAGEFRHRVTFQRNAGTVRDAYGQPVDVWANVDTVWASVEPLTGRELWHARQVLATASHRIRCRTYPDTTGTLTAAHRAVLSDGRILNGEFARDITERRIKTEFLCSEGGPSNSPFTPAAAGTLVLAGRALDLVTTAAADDPVSSVAAAYGTARAFASTLTRRPLYKLDQTPAGGPALLFDGSNDILTFTSTGALSAWHLFLVLKFTGVTGNQCYLGGAGGSSVGAIQSDAAESDIGVNDAVSSVPSLLYLSSPKTTTAFHVVEYELSSGTLKHRRDGVLLASAAATGNYTFGTLGDFSIGSGPLKAYVAEWLLYGEGLPTALAALDRRYLNDQHGTTLAA